MKNLTTKLLLFVSCIFFSIAAFSQDRVYLVNGDVLSVDIDTITDESLIYYMENNGQQVRYVVSFQEVLRVMKADGSIIKFPQKYKDPMLYEGQLKRSIKFHLFSPLLGHTAFSFEQSLRPGRSIEFSGGIIGLGNNFELGRVRRDDGTNFTEDVSQDPSGFHVGVGYKFFSKPAVRFTGWRYRHLLQGWYVMPKLIVGTYKENILVVQNSPFGEQVKKRHSVTFSGAMAYVGKQVIFSGSYFLDWQVGLGLGVDNEKNEEEDSPENHYVITMASGHLMLGGGLRVGFLF